VINFMLSRNALLYVCTAAAAFAADLPYAGKWKMNSAKSDFGATTITYETLPSGEWQSSADGQSYKFKMDGKDYSDGLGDTTAWKAIDATTWQTTWKLNGKVLNTDTMKVGADGSSLIVNTKGTKPSGAAIDETRAFQRVSGGPGLAGKWKTQNVKISSPGPMEFMPSGGDGLAFKEPEMGFSCESKLDGKDYPCTGPTLPPGWTIAMNKAGARSLDMVVKQNGKPFWKYTFTVAPDGKSMTETGGATATNEKIAVFFDRQ
jgi:hypothetical protein